MRTEARCYAAGFKDRERGHNSRNTSLEDGKDKERKFPLEPPYRTPWFLSQWNWFCPSDIQKWRRINMCYFKPPNLWRKKSCSWVPITFYLQQEAGQIWPAGSSLPTTALWTHLPPFIPLYSTGLYMPAFPQLNLSYRGQGFLEAGILHLNFGSFLTSCVT